MAEYHPSSLPAITSVEIVNLRDVEPNRISYMQAVEGIAGTTVTGEAAQTIASLWRQLPPGERTRCHIPPYGLRFRTGTNLICQASICWMCDNVYGNVDGKTMEFTFDAKAQISKDLLAEIKRAAGD